MMFTRQTLVASVVLAYIIAVGFATAWAFAGVWTGAALSQVSSSRPASESLLFLADGTPVIQVHSLRSARSLSMGYYSYSHSRYYRDLQGNEIEPPEDNATVQGTYLPSRRFENTLSSGSAWDGRVRSFTDFTREPTYWYFTSDGRKNGSAYFVGYDSESKALVGYLGKNGFRDGEIPLEERFVFSGPLSESDTRITGGFRWGTGFPRSDRLNRPSGDGIAFWNVFVHTDGGQLYEVDLRDRSSRLAMELPEFQSMEYCAGSDPRPNRGPRYLAVRTASEILTLNAERAVIRRTTIPEALRDKTFLWFETTRGDSVARVWPKQNILNHQTPIQVYWFNRAGQVTRSEELLLSSGVPEFRVTNGFFAAMFPSPAFAHVLIDAIMPLTMAEQMEKTFGEAQAKALSELWPALVMVQVLAVVLAIPCYRRQVRYARPTAERVAWPLFVLLFGLPGWIGYRFTQHWPPLETCPTCGATGPQNREACSACATPFPEPAVKGTEVFA